jgi:hypothetical protein
MTRMRDVEVSSLRAGGLVLGRVATLVDAPAVVTSRSVLVTRQTENVPRIAEPDHHG